MNRSTAAYLGLTATRTIAGTRRWWVRNTRTQQVLGSVFGAEHDEAMGKAMVKYGTGLYSRDGFTLQEGPNDAQDQRSACAQDGRDPAVPQQPPARAARSRSKRRA